MVVAMVVSLLFFFHVGGLGNVKSAAVQPNYGQQAPCPIKEADGNKAKYVENRNITLRAQRHEVLRLRQGGERRVAKPRVQPPDAGQLHQEGGSHDDRLRQERREIRRTPWQAISPMPCWLVDDRQDQLIDVIVGATFDNLQDAKKVPAAGKAITGIQGCVAVDKMTDLPKAPEHDAVNPQS